MRPFLTKSSISTKRITRTIAGVKRLAEVTWIGEASSRDGTILHFAVVDMNYFN